MIYNSNLLPTSLTVTIDIKANDSYVELKVRHLKYVYTTTFSSISNKGCFTNLTLAYDPVAFSTGCPCLTLVNCKPSLEVETVYVALCSP